LEDLKLYLKRVGAKEPEALGVIKPLEGLDGF
jgi:hypothetical protein